MMENEDALSASYVPFGDSGVVVEFGDVINLEINRRVIGLAAKIRNAQVQGVEEVVPTYRSLLVRYDPLKTSYEQLVFRIKDLEKTAENITSPEGRRIVIPVVYGGEYGPDIGYVAHLHRLNEEQVIKLHSSREYWVYMIGFIAGFPYLGEVADEIATARLETPRLRVPRGSVGIAEQQTGIYPVEAPGGWQIVGRTPCRLFDHKKQPPVLIDTGDKVRFKPITAAEYEEQLESVMK